MRNAVLTSDGHGPFFVFPLTTHTTRWIFRNIFRNSEVFFGRKLHFMRAEL